MGSSSILCAIDFTHASDEALKVALQETHRRDAVLDLIHVWYPADPLAADMGGVGLPVTHPETVRQLRQQLESIPVDLPPDRVRYHVEIGTAAEKIVEKANELGSDLLVVGTHARGVIGRWFIGSVANELLRIAPCPILVCRQPLGSESRRDESDPAAQASGH